MKRTTISTSHLMPPHHWATDTGTTELPAWLIGCPPTREIPVLALRPALPRLPRRGAGLVTGFWLAVGMAALCLWGPELLGHLILAAARVMP